jgi:hypothetical protein
MAQLPRDDETGSEKMDDGVAQWAFATLGPRMHFGFIKYILVSVN